MQLWLDPKIVPDPERAQPNGLVAIGGTLEPDVLLAAYRRGLFPWSSDPVISWWSPNPRCVFDLSTWKPHRSVVQAMRRAGWTYRVDHAFEAVMRACAESTPDRPSTWITDDFVTSYCELHRRGLAHSVEVYDGDTLVGGLYGLALGGFFGGESMFHRQTGASKAAVVELVRRLREGGYVLLDAQATNPHLTRLGATLIPRRKYLEILARALKLPATFSTADQGAP